jgi:LAO/AO transport system kinase
MRAQDRSIDSYLAGLKQSDRVVLGQAITLIESDNLAHRARAESLLAQLPPLNQATFRIGITGAPGAGKSTFIEALGMHFIGLGKRVAVLAIDPSSTVTGGSILGDKTRMEQLSAHQSAFVRPSAARTSLGGVAAHTREAITLVEAAGYDIVLIETVGVGQSEIAVHTITDVFLLLLIPGAGDELQGIKRGIVEMADFCVVNKADGDRLPLAKSAKSHYTNALHLFPAKSHGQTPEVFLVSSLDRTGISDVAQRLLKFEQINRDSGYFSTHRNLQNLFWFEEIIQAGLRIAFYQSPGMPALLERQRLAIEQGEMTAFAAGTEALKAFLNNRK